MKASFIDSVARSLGAKRLKVELPWETDPLKQFFGESQSLQVIRAPEWIDEPCDLQKVSDASSSCVVLDRFNAKTHLSNVSWACAEDAKLNSALQMWKVIVLDSTCNTKLGSTLMQCIQTGKDEDFVFQIISDVFSGKSTSTLKSRSSSLLSFGRWKRAVNSDRIPGLFPITEQLAYEYLCELRRTKAAASKRSRFLEAVGFSKGLLGADVDAVLESARGRGVAFGTLFPVTRKKNPLTVQQLVYLERLAMDHPGPEGVFAGYICFLVHCRLRWSDGQHCVDEPTVDVYEGRGFIEAALYHHKTAKKRRTQAGRLLPVAGVLPGLSGQLWTVAWLQNRKHLGLRASTESPTMPAPVAAGGWTKGPLSASEASVWLREILMPCTPQLLKDIATHSCKATVLSWMAKANTPMSLRRLAGYHVKPGDKSALEYSRDAAAPILRQIDGIMLAIRSGQFCPDACRSERWVGCTSIDEAVTLAANAQLYWDIGGECSVKTENVEDALDGWESAFELVSFPPQEEDLDSGKPLSSPELPTCFDSGQNLGWIDDDTPIVDLFSESELSRSARPFHVVSEIIHSDSDDFSDSSSSTEPDVSDLSEDERRCEIDGAVNASDLVAPSDLAGKKCYQRVKSSKFHFVEKCCDGFEVLRCGRRVTANYRQIETPPAFTLHGCLMCFGVRGDATAEESD